MMDYWIKRFYLHVLIYSGRLFMEYNISGWPIVQMSYLRLGKGEEGEWQLK
jgi:hypothetical protein